MNIIGFIYDNHIIMWYMIHGNYYESDPGLPLKHPEVHLKQKLCCQKNER